MRTKSRPLGREPGSLDRELAKLAAPQHGVVARRQLIAMGFGPSAVKHRARKGKLHRVHPGVYAVGHAALPELGRVLAGVLACGPFALLACRSAIWLWGLGPPPTRVEVLVEGHARGGHRGVLARRTRSLQPEERTTRDGVPVTSVARTLLDFAAVARGEQLGRVIKKAEERCLFDRAAVERVLERAGPRSGARRLRGAMSEIADVRPLTRSELERLFSALCREHGLPRPAHNLWVEGCEVDALWEEWKLIVEVDAYETHRTRAAFERDRRRDAALQVAGYRALRVTDMRLAREPAAVAADIRSLRVTV